MKAGDRWAAAVMALLVSSASRADLPPAPPPVPPAVPVVIPPSVEEQYTTEYLRKDDKGRAELLDRHINRKIDHQGLMQGMKTIRDSGCEYCVIVPRGGNFDTAPSRPPVPRPTEPIIDPLPACATPCKEGYICASGRCIKEAS